MSAFSYFFSVPIDFIFLFGANNCRRFVYIFMIYRNSFNTNLKIPTTEILTLTNIRHNNLPYINHDTLNWIFTFYDLCIYVAMRFVIIQIFIAFSCAPFCCVIFRFRENVVLSKLRHIPLSNRCLYQRKKGKWYFAKWNEFYTRPNMKDFYRIVYANMIKTTLFEFRNSKALLNSMKTMNLFSVKLPWLLNEKIITY